LLLDDSGIVPGLSQPLEYCDNPAEDLPGVPGEQQEQQAEQQQQQLMASVLLQQLLSSCAVLKL
jgi:hypothetical protein